MAINYKLMLNFQLHAMPFQFDYQLDKKSTENTVSPINQFENTNTNINYF